LFFELFVSVGGLGFFNKIVETGLLCAHAVLAIDQAKDKNKLNDKARQGRKRLSLKVVMTVEILFTC
jgi:hypothetical protein